MLLLLESEIAGDCNGGLTGHPSWTPRIFHPLLFLLLEPEPQSDDRTLDLDKFLITIHCSVSQCIKGTAILNVLESHSEKKK